MDMMKKLVRYATFLLILLSGVTLADSGLGRFASRQEIVGFWKVEWSGAIAGYPSPYPLKYQWWAFLEDGTVVSVHSNQAIEMNKVELEKFSRKTPQTVKWEFSDGFLKIIRSDDPSQELWGVNIQLSDHESKSGLKINKGDLLMSLDNGRGQIRYFRRLSKLN